MPISQPAISTEYLRLGPVVLTLPDGALYNPTADVVEIAFVTGGTIPGSGDWHAAAWETAANPLAYFVKILVGPDNSGIVLAKNAYTVWEHIGDSPEIVRRPVDTLTIT